MDEQALFKVGQQPLEVVEKQYRRIVSLRERTEIIQNRSAALMEALLAMIFLQAS